MFAGLKPWRLENKTMPIIFGAFRFVDIGAELICSGISDNLSSM